MMIFREVAWAFIATNFSPMASLGSQTRHGLQVSRVAVHWSFFPSDTFQFPLSCTFLHTWVPVPLPLSSCTCCYYSRYPPPVGTCAFVSTGVCRSHTCNSMGVGDNLRSNSTLAFLRGVEQRPSPSASLGFSSYLLYSTSGMYPRGVLHTMGVSTQRFSSRYLLILLAHFFREKNLYFLCLSSSKVYNPKRLELIYCFSN
jgi:hypothetical protein